MSWLSQNYEKAAIGGAAVVALALAYFGWTKVAGVDDQFSTNLKGRGSEEAAVKDSDLVTQAQRSLSLKRTWTQGEDEKRLVDLFTGIPLFIKRDAPGKPVDLIPDPAVHPPIANTWWIQNRLDPGFADSPSRDPDGDGFSNLEEFQAATNPNDPNSHPLPIAKLRFLKDDSLTWVLRPGFESDGGFTFQYRDSNRGENRAGATAIVMPGTLFFTTGVMKNRFKLVGSEQRKEMNPRIKQEVNVLIVKVEDQRPNKKGDVYEIPSQFPETRELDFAHYDRTAVLTLEALGQSGTEFKVEERTSFALPPNSPKKDYFLKEVTPDSIEVEYKDAAGVQKSVKISKGALPQLDR